MRIVSHVLSALCGLATLAAPAWAHPSTRIHAHGEELVSVIVVGIVLGALLVRPRSRSLAGPAGSRSSIGRLRRCR